MDGGDQAWRPSRRVGGKACCGRYALTCTHPQGQQQQQVPQHHVEAVIARLQLPGIEPVPRPSRGAPHNSLQR
jgi:hypothetical protein